MLWTILLIKKNNNGWYINYIENKLINQITKLKLEKVVEVVVFEPNLQIFADYISVIDKVEISDNFVEIIYNKLKNCKKDCVRLTAISYMDNVPLEVVLPISKLNPIKIDNIFELQDINYYINSENLSSIVKTIDTINIPVIYYEDLNKIPFSIIISAYKSQKYIEECLDSIENQTYFKDNDNYEILVGVDGCQDTLDKLQEIKDKYRNLHIYMMTENKGTYICCNTLIDLVKNENVIKFDSDDVMTPNMIKEVARNINDNDIMILGSLDLTNGVVGTKFLLTEGIIYFRKSMMDNIAGGYQPWICSADTELIKRLVNKVKITQLKKALFHRRLHSESLTQKEGTRYNSDLREGYKKLIKPHYTDNEIKIKKTTNTYNEIDNKNIKCIVYRPEKNVFDAVKKLIISKYKDNVEYNNSIVVLGYNLSFNIDKLRQENKNSKIIIYQLEQLYNNMSQWYNEKSDNKTILERTKNIKKILKNCDEIWDYDINNIKFLKQEGFNNIKHKPLEYTEELKKEYKNSEIYYDILFYGSLNDRRIKLLKILDKKYKLCIISNHQDFKKYKDCFINSDTFSDIYGDKLYNYIFKSKIIINIHYYESKLQEQVRLFELLINNKAIVSEKSLTNYFGDLIYEFNDIDEMIKIINNLILNDNWKNINVSERFKNKNYKEIKEYKVGAIYNIFYGLELIEKSINSIKNVVDYFILINQHYSIDMKILEPKINESILNRLRNKNLNIDIIYLDPNPKNIDLKYKHEYILSKRNLGLHYCRENKCDFIIPLDTDECYNEQELKCEIDYMYENNIDTLYCPIYSYYYNENYYFEDTYFVASVYKTNDRIFKKQKSSVLVDPVRKMEERKFRISKLHMHHYTYMKETYQDKMNLGLRTSNPIIKNDVEKIGDYLLNKWEHGKKALVFINDLNNGGNTILSFVDLNKKNVIE